MPKVNYLFVGRLNKPKTGVVIPKRVYIKETRAGLTISLLWVGLVD